MWKWALSKINIIFGEGKNASSYYPNFLVLIFLDRSSIHSYSSKVNLYQVMDLDNIREWKKSLSPLHELTNTLVFWNEMSQLILQTAIFIFRKGGGFNITKLHYHLSFILPAIITFNLQSSVNAQWFLWHLGKSLECTVPQLPYLTIFLSFFINNFHVCFYILMVYLIKCHIFYRCDWEASKMCNICNLHPKN